MVDSTTLHVDPSNREQGRAWDGDEGAYWAAHARRFDEAVAGYHDRLLAAAHIEPGHRVLDIGCGTGQTSRDAARVAFPGTVLGVDLSARMLDVARRQAEREGVANVGFLHADAQVHPFPAASFDVALSRTGTMFFGDRRAAFANIARALVPGGRLAMAVWQPLTENEWLREILGALAAGRDLAPPAPDAPGPLALSDPAAVTDLLTGSGFTPPTLEALHAPMYFGADAEDAFAFLLGLNEWMLDGLPADARADALDALRRILRRHETGTGVRLGSGMWCVTATRRS